MDKEVKDGIKRMAKEAEVKLTGALLKWRDRSDGREASDPEAIDRRSRIVTDKANEIMKRRGKAILKGFKDAYVKNPEEGDNGE